MAFLTTSMARPRKSVLDMIVRAGCYAQLSERRGYSLDDKRGMMLVGQFSWVCGETEVDSTFCWGVAVFKTQELVVESMVGVGRLLGKSTLVTVTPD